MQDDENKIDGEQSESFGGENSSNEAGGESAKKGIMELLDELFASNSTSSNDLTSKCDADAGDGQPSDEEKEPSSESNESCDKDESSDDTPIKRELSDAEILNIAHEIASSQKKRFVEMVDDYFLEISHCLIEDDDSQKDVFRCLKRLLYLEGRDVANDVLLDMKDQDLASAMRAHMFTFDDIVYLDDRSVQVLMRETDNDRLALALKDTNDEVRDKIFRNMSKRAAAMLKEDIEFMGPVRKKDVDYSQQHIVSTALRLEDAGSIVIRNFGEEYVV